MSSPDLEFDYGVLSPSVEKFLRGQADRIRRQCASSIIQIGKALIEAKRHLSHGMFLRWVDCEIGIPPRTAQAYMRAAHWTLGKSAIITRLPPSALYALSANGVPEEFVTDVLERVEAGETIAASGMRRELRAFQSKNGKESRAGETRAQRMIGQLREEAGRSEGSISESPIAELARLLAQKLSVSDFARVRKILTSDGVLSDPGLSEKIERQFR